MRKPSMLINGVFFIFSVCQLLFGQPQNVHVMNTTSKSISVSWDTLSGATGYKVYCNGRKYGSCSMVPYTLYHLEADTTYDVQVSAVAGDTEGQKSGIVYGTTLPLSIDSSLINPYTQLQYRGAFRPPEASSNGSNFGFSSGDIAFYPAGDTANTDSFPGSLFFGGNGTGRKVAEISIPEPINSRNISALPMASYVQGFYNIKSANMASGALSICPALEYLPAQGTQTQGYLYTCFGDNYQVGGGRLNSFGAAAPVLSNAVIFGGWYLGPAAAYTSPDYMSTIKFILSLPDAIQNKMLVAGGGRDGSHPQGATLVAYGPWNDGDPLPENNTVLSYTPLLMYGNSFDTHSLEGARENDLWRGGEWLTIGDKSAVVISGVKGWGDFWYSHAPYMSSYMPLLLYYDPRDLIAVANGAKQPYEPQPYAVLHLNDVILSPSSQDSSEGGSGPGGLAFDRQNGVLYMADYRAYGTYTANPVIHVWKLKDKGTSDAQKTVRSGSGAWADDISVSPNPFNSQTTITITGRSADAGRIRKIAIYAMNGALVGVYTAIDRLRFTWDATGLPSGMYIAQVEIGSTVLSKCIALM